jgi:hypothetical protein
MAKSSKLRIMISSRCDDYFPVAQTTSRLSDIRKDLKTEIEAVELFGKKLFEVWINEEAPPQGGTWDSWDVCMEAVNDCDILISISNGNAGWADAAGAIDELKSRCKEALYDATIALAQSGVREASHGKFHSGQALDWSRLDFITRQAEMRKVLRDAILARAGSIENGGRLFVLLGGQPILFVPHAIPAALSVSAARELVGQPFLHVHLQHDALTGKRSGPVHVIACHKTATESQATKLLGFPDATVVTPPFGVFVADNVQKIQCAFITNCRDEANTRHGVQRFFNWLTQTGEDALVAERAKARARIVRAIARELKP